LNLSCPAQADEWHFDNNTKMLSYAHNGTGPPPEDWQFVAPDLATLISVVGTKEEPVEDVTIRGLGFRDASITYMDAWGVPSGGDWALHRGGAVFLEHTARVTVEQSKFERVDGNALMVSGRNRNATIADNEFAWIGDCAVAARGRVESKSSTRLQCARN
jgi:hypothetical protein